MILSTLRKSVHVLKVWSGLVTNRHGEAQLEKEGTAISFSSMYFTSDSSCSGFGPGETRQKRCQMG